VCVFTGEWLLEGVEHDFRASPHSGISDEEIIPGRCEGVRLVVVARGTDPE
jgi:hypothetical protein